MGPRRRNQFVLLGAAVLVVSFLAWPRVTHCDFKRADGEPWQSWPATPLWLEHQGTRGNVPVETCTGVDYLEFQIDPAGRLSTQEGTWARISALPDGTRVFEEQGPYAPWNGAHLVCGPALAGVARARLLLAQLLSLFPNLASSFPAALLCGLLLSWREGRSRRGRGFASLWLSGRLLATAALLALAAWPGTPPAEILAGVAIAGSAQLLAAALFSLRALDAPSARWSAVPYPALLAATALFGVSVVTLVAISPLGDYPEGALARALMVEMSVAWALGYASLPIVARALLPRPIRLRVHRAGLALACFAGCQLLLDNDRQVRWFNVFLGPDLLRRTWKVPFETQLEASWALAVAAVLAAAAYVIARTERQNS